MRAAPLLIAVALGAGCYVKPGEMAPRPPVVLPNIPPPGMGSIWRSDRSANYPVTDVRAHFPGDLLTVLVAENSSGKKIASTDTKRASSLTASVKDFFGITSSMVPFLPADFTATPVVDASTALASKGDATTSRTGQLTASITVTVVEVEGNGNLRVRGDKIVTVNHEDQYLVLTGTVRPDDILSDNTVSSTRVADARISYYGYGVVGDKENVPLIHRAFDWIWPF